MKKIFLLFFLFIFINCATTPTRNIEINKKLMRSVESGKIILGSSFYKCLHDWPMPESQYGTISPVFVKVKGDKFPGNVVFLVPPGSLSLTFGMKVDNFSNVTAYARYKCTPGSNPVYSNDETFLDYYKIQDREIPSFTGSLAIVRGGFGSEPLKPDSNQWGWFKVRFKNLNASNWKEYSLLIKVNPKIYEKWRKTANWEAVWDMLYDDCHPEKPVKKKVDMSGIINLLLGD